MPQSRRTKYKHNSNTDITKAAISSHWIYFLLLATTEQLQLLDSNSVHCLALSAISFLLVSNNVVLIWAWEPLNKDPKFIISPVEISPKHYHKSILTTFNSSCDYSM